MSVTNVTDWGCQDTVTNVCEKFMRLALWRHS